MNRVYRIPGRIRTRKFGIFIALSLLLATAGVVAYLLIPRQAAPVGLIEREISRLERMVEQNPDDPDRRVELALLYSTAGSYQQAIAQLRVALELDESHQGALVALGDVYMELQRYGDAIEPYTKVVELNKDNPMRGISQQLEGVYYYLGVAYFNLGRPEDAVHSLEEALGIDKTDADAWYMLGRAYQHLGEFPKAIDSFAEAVRFVPDFTEAYQGLAQCYERTGESNFATYAQAMASYSLGSTGEAIRQLESVVATAPDFAEAYLGLGLAYEKEGQLDKAISSYEKALRLKPDLWLAQAKLQALGAK
jgi:tetratricopeptide (TPR) repeat protein